MAHERRVSYSALHHGGALTSTSEMAARPGTIDDEAQVPSYTLPPLLDDETTSTEDWCEPGHAPRTTQHATFPHSLYRVEMVDGCALRARAGRGGAHS